MYQQWQQFRVKRLHWFREKRTSIRYDNYFESFVLLRNALQSQMQICQYKNQMFVWDEDFSQWLTQRNEAKRFSIRASEGLQGTAEIKLYSITSSMKNLVILVSSTWSRVSRPFLSKPKPDWSIGLTVKIRTERPCDLLAIVDGSSRQTAS